MKTDTQKDTNRILVEDGRLIDKALEEGVREAMRRTPLEKQAA